MLTFPRSVALVVVLGGATAANAFENRWTMGLHVSTERLVGQTGVNGVMFRVERATGPDVSALAQRMRMDWEREQGADPVVTGSEGDWNIIGRIYRGESEVVQWRGLGDEAELIWSATDLQVRNSVPLVTVPIPRDCSWMPPVHGQVDGHWFLQVSGYCPRASTTLRAEVRQLLSGGEWILGRANGQILQLEHGNRRAQIAIIPVSNHSSPATNLVILELGVDSAQSQ